MLSHAPDARPAARPARRARREISDAALRRSLRVHFGIAGWRPGQADVVQRVLGGRDTLAVMPTGAGKSLCWQLPALHLDGLTVVVSPLIALMKDQVDKLARSGIRALQFNSAVGSAGEQAALETLRGGAAARIVFTTPERMTDAALVDLLRARGVALLVVDEAHSISAWGHDFRPSYLELAAVLPILGEPPVLALTATATDEVAQDIRQQLQRPRMAVIHTGTYRPGLHYAVQPVAAADKAAALVALAAAERGPGIVYAATVQGALDAQAALEAAEIATELYHGRLGRRERQRAQDAFMSGHARVMVATNAFGMGIDKPDIRFIVHWQIPGSLEAYYQESGRAGRDGRRARCVLLYDPKDRRVQRFFLVNRYPGAAEIQAAHAALCAADRPVTVADLVQALPQVAESKLRVALKLLRAAGLAASDRRLRYRARAVVGEVDHAALAQDYRRRADQDLDTLERMVAYAQTALCRWKALLDYFGTAAPWARCGHCDNCERPLDARVGLSAREALDPPTRVTAARAPAFEAGARVYVTRYGEGEVVLAGDDRVDVRFADGTVRTFLERWVQAQPPRRPGTRRH